MSENLDKKYAIIVAGGSGTRMKSDIPKQFLPLAGKPILVHTIEKFLLIPEVFIRLVLPKNEFDFWRNLGETFGSIQNNLHRITLVEGGKSRFQSVRNGLRSISGEGIVAVHDGVRPLVNASLIQKSFEVAAEKGSAVAAVDVKDSVRQIFADGKSRAVNRSELKLIQTPQTYQLSIFRRAFETEEQDFFTDCASVMDFMGYGIHLIEGHYENIKMTTPEDLIIGEAILSR